jgi:3-phosphoshikimate 1-carboxyvinyltransferase
LAEAFPKGAGKFQIEPDASSGSYFWGASWLLRRSEEDSGLPVWAKAVQQGKAKPTDWQSLKLSEVSVRGWPAAELQIDADFTVFYSDKFNPPVVISRKSDLADSIMTAIVLAPIARSPKPIEFTDLGRLRVQECERVVALRTELTKCGASVSEEGDTLTVQRSPLHGAEIETYNDHRMAMCFAILGLKVPGIKIKNPACVKKTFPNFFQKLAAAPPGGLGVTILDGKTGRKLGMDELFAD